MLVAMTVLLAPRPVCVLEHLVVEVNEIKAELKMTLNTQTTSFLACAPSWK